MTEIGTVIDGKYEVLREIGRGGMSFVYLAMDVRLKKQWAVKEIKKQGTGEHDEIVVNSLLAEADLMKKLDHAALPRIVDIIDNGVTLYVVMDYIEGKSLDKILKEHGAQTEERVREWAKQLCDVLSYLHSQDPPIIYRDMKPSNVMLKPTGKNELEGNVKIIDFGIAREYKEQNQKDTVVLGTKGYAPPEQYYGQTDARSDIYALGMTMHQLLTSVEPEPGKDYVPVRELIDTSEDIEEIIKKCVKPRVEERYQSCEELRSDLENGSGYIKKQKRQFAIFLVSVGLCIMMAIAGIILNLSAGHINNQDYEFNIAGSNPENYFAAIEIYPGRTEAYDKLIEYYKSHSADKEDITKIGNAIEAHANDLDLTELAVAELYYDMGKLYFSEYDGSFKSRAVSAQNFFEVASGSEVNFDKKEIADCYYAICRFMTNQSTTSEHSQEDYQALFEEIEGCMEIVGKAADNEANYDKISLYYVTMLLINDQAEYMAGVGLEREMALDLMENLYRNTNAITSTLDYVNKFKDEINSDYDMFVANVNMKYNEVEKRRQQSGQAGGN